MKILKKLGMFVLICTLLLSFTANVFAAGTTLNTYKNVKFGYQFQYEKTWKLNGSDSKAYTCYLRPVTYKGTAYPEVIVYVETLYQEAAMDEAVKQITDSLKSSTKNFKLLSSKAVKTSVSADSREIVFTFKVDNKYEVKEKMVIFVKDNTLYRVIYAALTKEYTKYEATYNTVLKTIKANSGSTNTLGLPSINTVLSSDQVKTELSDKTLEDADKINVSTSYGTDRDLTSDLEYTVSGLVRDVIEGKINESTEFEDTPGISPDIPTKQALIDLSKKYAELAKTKKQKATLFDFIKKTFKVVKNADGVTVGAIIQYVYDITDKDYNRIEGGTMEVYLKVDAEGYAGVYGVVKK